MQAGPSIEHILKSFPSYVKVEDLPHEDLNFKVQSKWYFKDSHLDESEHLAHFVCGRHGASVVSASDLGPEGREFEPWPVYPRCVLRQSI